MARAKEDARITKRIGGKERDKKCGSQDSLHFRKNTIHFSIAQRILPMCVGRCRTLQHQPSQIAIDSIKVGRWNHCKSDSSAAISQRGP